VCALLGPATFNDEVAMDFQVQRSAYRGIGYGMLGSAVGLLCLVLVTEAIVYSRGSSFSQLAMIFAVLAVPCLILVGLGVAVLNWRRLFPKTLQLRQGKLQLLHGNELVGQIPLTNVVEIKVVRESVQNYGGGAVGGLAAAFALKRIAAGKGLTLHIDDPQDKDTFWPEALQNRSFEFSLNTEWEITYQEIHDRLLPLVPKRPQPAAPPLVPPRLAGPSSPPRPVVEDNPFDFS
jgi:hypothetical protein